MGAWVPTPGAHASDQRSVYSESGGEHRWAECVVRPDQPENTNAPPADTVISWFGFTHPGAVRENNEDSYCVEERPAAGSTGSRFLLAVADGLGGHRSGEVASETAIETLRAGFQSWDGSSADRLVETMVQQANLAVFDSAHESPERFNMQTTLTAAMIGDDQLVVSHVGDCRLYRIRDGEVEALTRDHTMVMELLRMRMISPEQAVDHPGRHQLTRSLGAELLLRVDTVREKIAVGDVYLLCSDGLWGEVTVTEVRDALLSSGPKAGCDELLSLALARGAPDNTTGIAAQILSVSSRPPPESRWRALLRRAPR